LALFSWLSIILALLAGAAIPLLGKSIETATAAMIGGGLVLLLAVAGFLSGIIALCGMGTHGREGILAPALTGLLLWMVLGFFGLLGSIAVPSFLRARQRAIEARKPLVLGPATHALGAKQVEDPEAGFSFDLPEGFATLPGEGNKEYTHRFQGHAADGSRAFILVKRLPLAFPRRRLLISDLPRGKSVSLTAFSWRGVEVDGVRVPETTPNGDFLTFNVQIPLPKQFVQIGVGGAPAAEEGLRALAVQVLDSLEGEPKR
jgi:hypothetical protein